MIQSIDDYLAQLKKNFPVVTEQQYRTHSPMLRST